MVLMVRGRPLTGRRIFAWLVLLVPTVIGIYLWMAWNAGRAELREMCQRDSGPKVYKKVSAPGYFHGQEHCVSQGCWTLLTGSGFRFVEFEQRDTRSYDPLPRDGYFRLTTVERSSGLCDPMIQKGLDSWQVYKDFVAEGKCIQLEQIDAPTAPVGFFAESLPNIELDNLFSSVIKVRHRMLKDMRDSSLIAEETSYLLFQRSMPSFSSFSPMLHCQTRGIGGERKEPTITAVRFYITPE